MRVVQALGLAALLGCMPVRATTMPSTAGSWVSVSVEIDGQRAPLYAASDGDRHYVEAIEGRRYAVRLTNRTGERVGVEIEVDGLNVISGESRRPGLGRMYVLSPWESTVVQGWRTSLESVRRFTFVNEKVSYAARAGKANGKMGWIEVAVHREHRDLVAERREDWRGRPVPEAKAQAEDAPSRDGRAKDEAQSAPSAGAARSYPGTGWGDRMQDRVQLVDFDPEPTPVERVTLRYEYHSGLVALGVLPANDRLSERERGDGGFVPPPRW